ncbi:MAG: hypothetical protein HOA30_07455 [Rhodospirillaceae bacterium]|jgi:hypothetical protein|nr:hypothetical protein [Rhodospirillaceae bacterium]MBT5565075.1 hypothetical protein [Rhodospirillaceae bacterium]MBT6088097.1 hypothetical protein [Rhodospirillaceae bacterium]MBT6883875.1 hypothetical protein [Rhodospirillaceae bacterium]MBT7450715.1 hypothetical protein [Rhodospirillaceae bacterium]
MSHRTYRGKLVYLTDGVGEEGREFFTVTVQPDGSRILRAHCEMDNDHLIRDVVYALDGDWQPEECFVRLTIGGKHQGSAVFRFTDTHVTCDALTADDGHLSQSFEVSERVPSFGAHPLCCDTWHSKKGDLVRGESIIGQLRNVALSSPLPNGGSGPSLSFVGVDVVYAGTEEITVPAGTFKTKHMINQSLRDGGTKPPVEIWAYSDDFIPVRGRWELLHQTYELVELSYTDPVAPKDSDAGSSWDRLADFDKTVG